VREKGVCVCVSETKLDSASDEYEECSRYPRDLGVCVRVRKRVGWVNQNSGIQPKIQRTVNQKSRKIKQIQKSPNEILDPSPTPNPDSDP